jgi:hypothetical protein
MIVTVSSPGFDGTVLAPLTSTALPSFDDTAQRQEGNDKRVRERLAKFHEDCSQ